MTRLGWQYRDQGSGRPVRQRVAIYPAPAPDPGRVAVIKHAATCTTCDLLPYGGYCQQAARVRQEAER